MWRWRCFLCDIRQLKLSACVFLIMIMIIKEMCILSVSSAVSETEPRWSAIPGGVAFSFCSRSARLQTAAPPYCADISRELVIILTCLLGLNVQSAIIKPHPSFAALTRYPHTSGGGVKWGADGANKCPCETARVQPSRTAPRTREVKSNSLQSVLMAPGADAREAEVSATLNLFNNKMKRENEEEEMEAFTRSLIYF